MKALDLCCGAGGLTLGLQRAGFEVYGFDFDADAIDTHRRHAGPASRVDIKRRLCLDAEEPAPWFPPLADVVAGGVPCQPFSAAGLGLGLDDPRYLVPDFLRIAREAGSRAVLLENVRGLVLKPKAFRAVLDAFEAEWLTTWTVVDAADFGVPQHRDRLFVVGFKDAAARARFRWPQPTHAPPGSLFGAPYRTVREALSLGAPRPLGMLDRPAPTITAGGTEGGGGAEPIANRRRRTELVAELEAAGLADRPATTVQGDPRLAVAGHHDRQQGGAVRLTPEQCALLQGFPAGWTWTGNKSSQHRQIGNAVPPALAEAVARAVMAALRASPGAT